MSNWRYRRCHHSKCEKDLFSFWGSLSPSSYFKTKANSQRGVQRVSKALFNFAFREEMTTKFAKNRLGLPHSVALVPEVATSFNQKKTTDESFQRVE